MLKNLITRIDLVIPLSHSLQSNLDFILSNFSQRFLPTTKLDMIVFKDTFKKLIDRITVIIGDFKRRFPNNEPSYALKTFIHIFYMLKTQYETAEIAQVDQILTDIVVKAVTNDYNYAKSHVFEIGEKGKDAEVVNYRHLCEQLILLIDQIDKYFPAFEEYIFEC